jgi:hypothetical protein
MAMISWPYASAHFWHWASCLSRELLSSLTRESRATSMSLMSAANPADREIVEAKVAELSRLGASVQRRTREDDPDDPIYFVLMNDPQGNEFCVS